MGSPLKDGLVEVMKLFEASQKAFVQGNKDDAMLQAISGFMVFATSLGLSLGDSHERSAKAREEANILYEKRTEFFERIARALEYQNERKYHST